MGSAATIESCGAIESGFSCVMMTDRKLRLAWAPCYAELAAMQKAKHPSEAVVAERLREYLATGSLKRPEFSLRIVRGLQRC
jgi:hypothetical protein